MTNSAASGSERSAAFDRLHPLVQQWVYRQGWRDLRAVQEQAVEPILAGADVVLAAATAAGKTEAAFLPICSHLAWAPASSVGAVCLSPLKALINDQFGRLEPLCEVLGTRLTRWHGDADQAAKRRLVAQPEGILLITPESLEALFCNHGTQVARVFEALAYVVVDELHAFIGTERGRQLQSLLHRLEVVLGRRVPRVGLSATLGQPELAGEFLRPGGATVIVNADSGGQEIQLLLRGYREPPPPDGPDDDDDQLSSSREAIASELYRVLRGRHNLVFANSRMRVEEYADRLRRLSQERRVPNEFLPHHGSLSAGLRDDVERRLKDDTTPLSVVCTNTLELGIDIGDVTSIAQIGTPPSVAALRQRLGRSGRRAGQSAVLRLFVEEATLDAQSSPPDLLREHLFQAVAMVELLLSGWCEPPIVGRLHLSTLVQQLLAVVAQYGGVSAQAAYRLLCADGPFDGVSSAAFAQLLRALGARDLLSQDAQGLLLGGVGERLVNHYSFYAAFATPEEYRLLHGSTTLGQLPVDRPVLVDSYLIFAGRRWLVRHVDGEHRTILVEPAAAGRAPRFGGGGGWVHDRVRQAMRDLYRGTPVPAYLDSGAALFLTEGRHWYRQLGLDGGDLVAHGGETWWFPWCGDRTLHTLWLALLAKGAPARAEDCALALATDDAQGLLRSLAGTAPPDPLALAAMVPNQVTEKHHPWLDKELLARDYAGAHLDVDAAWRVLGALAPSAR